MLKTLMFFARLLKAGPPPGGQAMTGLLLVSARHFVAICGNSGALTRGRGGCNRVHLDATEG